MSSFKRKSEKVLNVFNKTVEDLSKINEKVSEKSSQIQNMINEMTVEKDDLDTLKKRNQGIISKINKIIE